MRAAWLLIALGACEPADWPPLATRGPVHGEVHVPAGLSGDAWLFLFRRGEAFPSVPLAASSVSAVRLEAGDAHFVFDGVAPNPLSLWGLLDVDQDFDPTIDVLTQPTAGDRIATHAVDLNVQPSRGATGAIELDGLVATEPPAFRLDVQGDVELSTRPNAPTTLTLLADPVGHFDPRRTQFMVGLVDADGDGRADDANGDGVPDLSLNVVLRWRPKPGQLDEGEVFMAMVYDPSPFLQTLQGRLGLAVAADRLTVTLLPVPQQRLPDGSLRTFGAPPAGEWELVVLSSSGQFWRVPNQLHGSHQSVRLLLP